MPKKLSDTLKKIEEEKDKKKSKRKQDPSWDEWKIADEAAEIIGKN